MWNFGGGKAKQQSKAIRHLYLMWALTLMEAKLQLTSISSIMLYQLTCSGTLFNELHIEHLKSYKIFPYQS